VLGGEPEPAIMFASTSKITYAGSGVAFLAASPANVAWYTGQHQQFASIGPDKVNQLRHVEFFGSAQGVRDHMAKHRAILAPKFAAVDTALSTELAGLGVADWTHRPAATSSISTSSTGRPRAWSPWPRKPASC
jgi:DNA-binding transcriptional MocR family regulator